MPKSQFALFLSRNFAPLFMTMFLGAFNDNFFKSAMVILITFRLAAGTDFSAPMLVSAASGVFILPFFLFSAFAGQLANKYNRSTLVQWIKLLEILVMGGAVVGFYTGSVWLLMFILFMMGAQSALFGPIKYSILPQLLHQDELVGANGLVEMGTFLAILFGTIFGGLFILSEGGLATVSVLIILIAAAGWFASRHIPDTVPLDSDLRVNFNFLLEIKKVVDDICPRHELFLPVIGKSWFYLVGSTFLALFPSYARDVIGADEQVATLFLGVFSVGIAAGSLACNVLLKGEVSGRFVPYAALGMSCATILLYLLSVHVTYSADVLGIGVFLASSLNLVILFCLFAISFFGGLYIVPLSAIIQSRSEGNETAKVIACGNITDSLFMVVSSGGSMILLKIGCSIPQIFLAAALLTIVVLPVVRRAIRSSR